MLVQTRLHAHPECFLPVCCRYTSRLSVSMQSVRLVVLQPFLAALQRLSHSDSMRAVTRMGSARAAKVAKGTLEQLANTVNLMQVKVEVLNPTIAIPESPLQVRVPSALLMRGADGSLGILFAGDDLATQASVRTKTG